MAARHGVEEGGIAGRYPKIDGGDGTGYVGGDACAKGIAVFEAGAVNGIGAFNVTSLATFKFARMAEP